MSKKNLLKRVFQKYFLIILQNYVHEKLDKPEMRMTSNEFKKTERHQQKKIIIKKNRILKKLHTTLWLIGWVL